MWTVACSHLAELWSSDGGLAPELDHPPRAFGREAFDLGDEGSVEEREADESPTVGVGLGVEDLTALRLGEAPAEDLAQRRHVVRRLLAEQAVESADDLDVV